MKAVGDRLFLLCKGRNLTALIMFPHQPSPHNLGGQETCEVQPFSLDRWLKNISAISSPSLLVKSTCDISADCGV